MNPMQYAYDLYVKSFKVVDIYDDFIVNDIFIESVDPCICCSLWEYWALDPQADVTNISFKVKSM